MNSFNKSEFEMNWLVWIHILTFFVLIYAVDYIRMENGKYFENLICLIELHITLIQLFHIAIFLDLLFNFF